MLIVGVVTAAFLISARIWRFVVYGGIAGLAATNVVLACRLEFGIQGPHSYTDGGPEVVYGMRPYVVQVGASVGGSVGLAASKARATAAA